MEERPIFCDAHVHLAQCQAEDAAAFARKVNYRALACALDRDEFLHLQEISQDYGKRILISYGIHPQNPLLQSAESLKQNFKAFSSELEFLEGLLREKTIAAVGESGLDFFTPELRAGAEAQREAWLACLGIAERYAAPLVVHARKSFDEILRSANRLARLPAVIFHSFPFAVREAELLLRRGVNAYFSLGKPLLRGSRRQADCARLIPIWRLLLETDAPFQTLKGQAQSLPSEIASVYSAAAGIRGTALNELCSALERNFEGLFPR